MTPPSLAISNQKVSPNTLQPDTRNILWIVIVSVAIMAPAIIFGVPSNHDLTNHFRFALPFYDAIRLGHFYPGWLAESNNGYGDPSFRFYPPALYYALAAARALTGNWYSSHLLTFTFLSIVGGVGTYLWARTIMSSDSALCAAIIYALAPYHLNQFYEATLLAELAGSSLIPFSFFFIERLCQKQRIRDMAGLAISFALLVLTHLPLTVIGSIALLFYAGLRLPKTGRWRTLFMLGGGVLLGLAASASYWVCMLAERNFIRADVFLADPSAYSHLDFLFSTFSPENLNVWWMNILTLFTFLMIWPAAMLLWPKLRGSINSRATISVALLMLFSLVMATQISLPIWHFVRPLQQTQFPWRWLAITSLAGSLLVAMSWPVWTKLYAGKRRPFALLALGSVVLSVAFSASHTIREAIFLPKRDFETRIQSIPGSASLTFWLPTWASENIREMPAPLEISGRTTRVDSWEPETRSFLVGAGEPGYMRVRTLYYPYWIATTQGQRLATSAAEDGALLISLPSQGLPIDLRFIEPPRVHAVAVITALGWLVIAGILVTVPIKRRLLPHR
jgi:6-pyruvoyl-tetrahydropterin synthase related domain